MPASRALLRRGALLGILAACAMTYPASLVSAAGFECPKDGTVVAYDTAGQATKAMYHGTDPTDPLICIREGGQGRRGSFLFNYYFINSKDAASVSELDQARKALPAFFAGTADQVSFERAAVVRHEESRGTQRWKDTWQRLGRDVVPVAGRSIPTEHLRVTTEGVSGNTYLGTWDFWYDTADHVMLRSRYSAERGVCAGCRGSDAVSLTVP